MTDANRNARGEQTCKCGGIIRRVVCTETLSQFKCSRCGPQLGFVPTPQKVKPVLSPPQAGPQASTLAADPT